MVKWKKQTLRILRFQQWQKVNEGPLDDPIYLPSDASNIRLCAKTCVTSPAKKGGMLPYPWLPFHAFYQWFATKIGSSQISDIQSLLGGNGTNPSEYIGIASQENSWKPLEQLAPESHDGCKRFAGFLFGFRVLPRKLTRPMKNSGWKTTFPFEMASLFRGTFVRFLGV